MKHIVTILMASYGTGSMYEASQISYDILMNISGKLDLTGERRLATYFWLEDCIGDTKFQSTIRYKSSSSMSRISYFDYAEVTKSLLAYIHSSIQQGIDRSQIFRGLELIQKLCSNPENEIVMANCPNEVLETLMELLCCNVTSTEPLHMAEINTFSGANSLAAVGSSRTKLLQHYSRLPACESNFFIDLSDFDIREQALDSLLAMCQISPDIQLRLAEVPHGMEILIRILETKNQPSVLGMRIDNGPSKVINILQLMARRVPENNEKFKTIHSQLCRLACSHLDVQGIHYVYNIYIII